MVYPQIMTALSGNKISSVNMWEKYRRDEILQLFENYEFGVVPIERPEDLTFGVKEIVREQGILQKKISIGFCGYEIKADLFVPDGNTKPLPTFLLVMHQAPVRNCDYENGLDFEFIPITDIIKRGYAVVAVPLYHISADFFENGKYTGGVFDVLDGERKDNSWSIIAAWSWGARRVMDYLETDKDVDSGKVVVVGHSRGGKTALWTGACDKRFAMAVSNDSGCAGAAFTRGKKGEHLDFINTNTDWFCENYKKYNDNEDMLPFDQHMLLSLMAPRPLYVASSTEDEWSDPESELKSCLLASEAYELYGLKGAVVPENGAEIDTPYHKGKIGYHNKTGVHGLTKTDWKFFMDFTDQHIK